MPPQKQQLSWSELRVGILVLAGLFLIAVGIFYVTGAGILVPKYRVKTYLPEVEGLTIGAPVRLDGVEIGNVDAIRMNPQPADRNRNIELVLRLDKRFDEHVRTDSTAQLITEGLLGNRYVSIRRGLTGEKVKPEGEVRGVEEAAMKQIVERGADLVQNLNVVSQHVRQLVTRLEQGEGTLGLLLTDEQLYNRANSIVTRAEQVLADAQAGKGTIGKLLTDEALYEKTRATVDRTETLLADIQAQKGTLGKIIYDPVLYENAKQFTERGNTLISDIQSGKGTLGKLATDEALYENLRTAAANIESATSKLNQGQGTAGKMFTDPAFYDNITGLAGDMRLLVGEFRKDPKKFLRVKFSLF
jgi:phospholipid/cholesterol/gamma-HCH transport system substrate-binding protein